MRGVVALAVAIAGLYAWVAVVLMPKQLQEWRLRHLRRGVDLLLHLIQSDPAGWTIGDRDARHRATGIAVRIDGGPKNVRIWIGDRIDRTVVPGPLSRVRIYKALTTIGQLKTDEIAKAVDDWIQREAQKALRK